MENNGVWRFVHHLRRELDALVEGTLAIAGAAPLRRQSEGGRTVTSLQLTQAQRFAVSENEKHLMRLASAAAALLRRRGLDGEAEVRELAGEMALCLSLRWFDREDVRDRVWRAKLHRELLRISIELT